MTFGTFGREKCGNVSLNLLFPILSLSLLSAPVESSWEKDLALPREDQDSSIEGKHAMSERMRIISDLLAVLWAIFKQMGHSGRSNNHKSFFFSIRNDML